MARTRKQTTTHNGFAIPLQPDTDLGLAMLIAEFHPRVATDSFRYEPVAVVATLNEAREVASQDRAIRDREYKIEPQIYRVWARGIGGDYIEAGIA